MKHKAEELIPPHKDGAQTNTESSVELSSEKEAHEFYFVVKNRLLNVNQWQEYAGKGTADFCLIDERGKEVRRLAHKGDYLKIDIPGPGTEAGNGKDWARIEDIAEPNNNSQESIVMLVRPAPDPLHPEENTAHFFSDESTSTFLVKRENKNVMAAVYGRNEKPNTDTDILRDKIRNTAMAAGAIAGFSKIQWKNLVDGLLKKE